MCANHINPKYVPDWELHSWRQSDILHWKLRPRSQQPARPAIRAVCQEAAPQWHVPILCQQVPMLQCLCFLLIYLHFRTFSQTGFQVKLRRRRTPILLQVSMFKPKQKCYIFFKHFKVYLPTGLFVVVSWISFIVPPEVVPGILSRFGKLINYPQKTKQNHFETLIISINNGEWLGRMSLLVTLFLVLVNIFNFVSANAPKVTKIEVTPNCCSLHIMCVCQTQQWHG